MSNLAGKPPLGQKSPPARSRAITTSARDETCTLGLDGCDHNLTVVFCHLRVFSWGGMGMKPDDFLGVYACHNCHAMLDGRTGEHPVSHSDILRALGATLRRLYAKGLLSVG